MKRVIKENKVLFVLSIIVIIALIIMAFGLLKYFYGTDTDKYGDRLKGIEEVTITEEHKDEVVKSIEEDEKVTKADLFVTGKIIYIKF